MRLSYSQLEWFLRCPYIYKYLYIDGNKLPKGKDAIFGALLHKVLEDVYKDRPVLLTLSEALALYEQEWERREADSYFATPLDAQMHFKEGLYVINTYYQTNNLEDTRILALEQFFEVPIIDEQTSQTHLLTGRIDRIDKVAQGIEIIDYKTGKLLKSEAQIADDLQLSLYHLGVAALWPELFGKTQERQVRVSLYFLRHNEKVSVIKTAEQLQETKEKLLGYIRQIQEAIASEKFVPIASTLCAREPYCRICPHFSDRYKTDKPLIEEKFEVKEIIKEYIALKLQEKQVKIRVAQLNQLVNTYLDQQKLEAIYDDANGIARSSIPSYELDLAIVKKILEPLGKWEAVLDLSKTKFNKIKKELPAQYREQLTKAQKLKKTVKILRVKKTAA